MKRQFEEHDTADNRGAWDTRELRRKEETFKRRMAAGLAVLNDQSHCRKRVVEKVAKRIGRSERYVWGTVKLGAKIHATGPNTPHNWTLTAPKRTDSC
jgi:hypothetical protein